MSVKSGFIALQGTDAEGKDVMGRLVEIWETEEGQKYNLMEMRFSQRQCASMIRTHPTRMLAGPDMFHLYHSDTHELIASTWHPCQLPEHVQIERVRDPKKHELIQVTVCDDQEQDQNIKLKLQTIAGLSVKKIETHRTFRIGITTP